MKNNVKVHLHLDSHKRKSDGKSKFSLRVAIGRKKKLYLVFPRRSDQPFMAGKFWVNETCPESGATLKSKRIKHAKGNSNSRQLERALMQQVEALHQLVGKLEREGYEISHELLKLHWENEHAETFSDWIFGWLERYNQERNITKSTYLGYKGNLNKIREYEQAGNLVDAGTISVVWLVGYQKWMLNEKGLKSRTVHTCMTQIGVLMRFAKSNGALARNVYQDFLDKKLMVKTEIKPGAYLDDQEVERLYRAFVNDEILLHPRLALRDGTPSIRAEKYHGRLAMALFTCYTGLRIGDVKRVSTNHPSLKIERDRFSLEMKKTKRTITIPISERLRTVANLTGMGPVFETKCVDCDHMNASLRLTLELLGIEKYVTFHGLRRSFASYMLNQDVPLKVVSELLGHANTLLTEQRYAFLNDKRKQEAVAVFDKGRSIVFENPEVREFVEDVYQLLQANPGIRLPKRMQERIAQLKEQLGLDVLDIVEERKGVFRAV